MGLPGAIVVTAGALILLAAQAQPLSASDGNGGLAQPLSGVSFGAAARSPRLGNAAPLAMNRGDRTATVRTVAAVSTTGVGGGVCGSSACTDQAVRQAVKAPPAPTMPTTPNHVLLLAAVGAVAFMASRRRIGG